MYNDIFFTLLQDKKELPDCNCDTLTIGEFLSLSNMNAAYPFMYSDIIEIVFYSYFIFLYLKILSINKTYPKTISKSVTYIKNTI